MRRPFLTALAAATAFTLSLALPAFAQDHHDGHGEGHAQGGGGHPAPPPSAPAPRAQPAPARPAFVPQGRPSGAPQGVPQFDRGRFGGGQQQPQFERGRFGGGQPQQQAQGHFRVYEAPQGAPAQAFGQAQARPDHARPQSVDPQFRGNQPAQGFARGQYERGSVRPGFVDTGQGGGDRGRADNRQGFGANRQGQAGDRGSGDRGRFDNRQGFQDNRQGQGGDRGGSDRRQGFVDNGQRRGDQGRFERGHDGARFDGGHDRGHDFERERHEYQREHVDLGRFGGNADRYRHDYAFREWRGREYDPVRLQIINEYGYRPFGYGLGYGFNPGIGWGFDLRFGYWYGPRYYDPGYDFWYGPETYYREGVAPEELISRDSRLYNWALQWFDYDRDGYLERNELIDAARAFRRFADFDGNAYIDGREYNYALERIDGYQPERY